MAVAPVAEITARDPRASASVKVFLTDVLLPFMKAFELSERAMIARLVLAEGERFPMVMKLYAKHVYTPYNDLVRRCAEIALETRELKRRDLVENPELMIAPIWTGLIHNHILCPEAPIDIGKLFETRLELLFSQ
jgi:hypothetical protein